MENIATVSMAYARCSHEHLAEPLGGKTGDAPMQAKTAQFVAYFRVSTDKQGRSGLGLEAQREAVQRYIASVGGTLISEHVEVESGKRNDRPKLAEALAVCRKRRVAKLVIAKLDRLSRNVCFIATIMDSGVEFLACDNPHATRLTLHILAAVAEHEREMISARTKAALAASKARGTRLGRHGAETLAPAYKAAAQARAEELRPVLMELAGKTTREIAAELTARGIPTLRGGRWQAQSVANVLRRLAASPQPVPAPAVSAVEVQPAPAADLLAQSKAAKLEREQRALAVRARRMARR
jgi:DNA invertase Pin-like site-specific DNA recombinase